MDSVKAHPATVARVEQVIRLNAFNLAQFLVENDSVANIQFVEIVDKESGEIRAAISWSRSE